ncbi:MAG: OB-fold nucleic acid binding domain-containing protein [Gammaproteobacteria bacterium]
MGNVHIPEAIPLLRRPTEGEEVVRDYASLGLTLRSHPLALLRGELKRLGLMTALEVHALPHGSPVRTGGLVIARQRPGTASGVVFITLEDETGHINLIVWNRFVERARRVLLGARLLGVRGEVQREGEVLHVITQHVDDYSHLLGELVVPFRDFH